MPVSISTVRFTTHYVRFDDVALALDAIESVERFSEEVENNRIWHLKIRMESGRRYDFTFNNPMENEFERMIA
jgi:hypothetical protein